MIIRDCWKKVAREQDEDLLQVADAGPQDGQRDQRHDRHVAHRRDQRLERAFDDAEITHENADRHGDDGGGGPADEDAIDADGGVRYEDPFRKLAPAFFKHGPRARQEQRLDHA